VSLRRRTVLGTVVLPLLTGCGSRSDEPATTASATTRQPAAGPDGAATATDRTAGGDATERTDERGTSSDRRIGTLTVVNDAATDRYVTVAVDDGDDTLLVESRTVRQGTAVELDGRIPTGDYRVVVETASGIRDQFDWTVTSSLSTLRVRVNAGVRFSRPALCDPDCALAVRGASSGYPDGGFDPRGRRAGSELRVYNPGDREERVRIRVADGTVLDYRYRVPPSVVLTVPVPQRSGETAVRVDVAAGRGRSFDWAMETDPVRYVLLDG
jgi:hypothetical protein